MTPSLDFDTPATLEDCKQAGDRFGKAWSHRPRTEFEDALVKRLTMLTEALVESSLDATSAEAAFDVAAWDGWEAAHGAENDPIPEPKRRSESARKSRRGV